MNSKNFKKHIIPHSGQIYKLAYRLLGNDADAKDAVQEIMLKLWKIRENIENHPNISAFIFLSARNHCLDQIRSKRKMKTVDLKDETGHSYDSGLFNLNYSDTMKIIEHFLVKLPELQKEVLILKDIDGFEIKEISMIKEIKKEHARVLLSRARKQLKTHLIKFENYESGTKKETTRSI